MILLKFIFWVAAIYLGLILFIRFFGPWLTRNLMRYFIKKAQQDMDRQSRHYHQYAEGHSPFEDNVYIDGDTKVSIRRGEKKKQSKKKSEKIDPSLIEEVEYEDLD